jgi:DNA-directed RNA polymerase III subunit RPC11
MLLVGKDDVDENQWECSICLYRFPIAKQMTTRQKLTRKQVDGITGGEDA